MTDLSPAARAIVEAFEKAWRLSDADPFECYIQPVGAVLRAAADRAIRGPKHYEGLRPDDYDNGWNEALGYIMSIAAELEGLQ